MVDRGKARCLIHLFTLGEWGNSFTKGVARMMPGGGLEPPTRGFSVPLFCRILRKTMAATFNPATDFPPAVDTVEKALAHLILLAGDLYGLDVYQELPGALMERVADTNIIRAADGTTRLIGRIAIPLNTDYITATSQKLWTFAEGFTASNPTVPAAYKVD